MYSEKMWLNCEIHKYTSWFQLICKKYTYLKYVRNVGFVKCKNFFFKKLEVLFDRMWVKTEKENRLFPKRQLKNKCNGYTSN